MKIASILVGVSLLVQYYNDNYKQADLDKTLRDLENDLSLPRIQTYDFIVVGSGTGGSLVAGKLSEHFKVLLLEAGGSPVPTVSNPVLNYFVSTHPANTNFFVSIPQHNFTLDNGGISTSRVGRMLGGSGSHNGNLYNRGSPHDYDYFANVTQDDSWSYSNVLKYFKSYENFKGKLVNENEREAYYSTSGELSVETDWSPVLPAWFQSAKELGFKTGDPNGNQIESFTTSVKSLKNGERASSYSTFVKPREQNASGFLTVLRYSSVHEILINENKTAYGVLYKRHGIPQIAHASKEVIVSCGTFQSPLLLIKSGIGPRAVLEEAKIPVKSDLPVGKTFIDHPAVELGFIVNSPNLTLLPDFTTPSEIEEQLNLFQSNPRKGYFTRISNSPQAFIVSQRAKQEGQGTWPDLQIVFVYNPILNSREKTVIRLQIMLGRGKSVGEIGFNTTAYLNGETDDTKLALVDFRLLSEASDPTVLIEGIKFALKIMENTTAFKEMGVTYNEPAITPCAHFEYRSDEYWRCYVAQKARSWLHPTGPCKMGRRDDPTAVLDSKLRVKGIKNLRVVDASVLPKPTNTNLNAAVMLVAAKACDDILTQYKDKAKF